MDKKDYKTVSFSAKDELIEKKSRFIGAVEPVTTEDEAINFIAQKKKQHYDATHNVYAYILRSGAARYSDDGEPSGTAGMPVMEVLKKENLTDVCVVVTRYFGGTLLGAGGLVRAYGKAAKLGIDAAKITEMIYCRTIKITCDYDIFGKVKHKIENGDYILEGTDYTSCVTAHVSVREAEAEKFKKEIVEITNGNAEIVDDGEKFAAKIL